MNLHKTLVYVLYKQHVSLAHPYLKINDVTQTINPKQQQK